MKNVIVTGANGFVGSALISQLIKSRIRVIALDITENPFRLDLSSAYLTYHCIDIKQIETIFEKMSSYQPDTFYHFAWIGSAGQLREDIGIQVDNALLTVAMLNFAKKTGCKKFVLSLIHI